MERTLTQRVITRRGLPPPPPAPPPLIPPLPTPIGTPLPEPNADQQQQEPYVTTPKELANAFWFINSVFWLCEIICGPEPILTWRLVRHLYVVSVTVPVLGLWVGRNWVVWKAREEQKCSITGIYWELATLNYASFLSGKLIAFALDASYPSLYFHIISVLLFLYLAVRYANLKRDLWRARNPQQQQSRQQPRQHNPLSYSTDIEEFAMLLSVASSATSLIQEILTPETKLRMSYFDIFLFISTTIRPVLWARRNLRVWLAHQRQQQQQQGQHSYSVTAWEIYAIVCWVGKILLMATGPPRRFLTPSLAGVVWLIWDPFVVTVTCAHRNWVVWRARQAQGGQGG